VDPAVIAEALVGLRGGGSRRADARRNVLRLVAAAQEAVDEVGVKAGAHEIARRAGVGVGTFYRQVGSLDDLLSAVLNELIMRLVRAADAALEHPDPWQGFAGFAADWVGQGSLSCGVRDVMEGQDALDLTPVLTELRTRLERLVERLHRAGLLRAGVRWQDVASLFTGMTTSAPDALGVPVGAGQWRRNLDVVLAGLRA
jgi:AcrR family transcriptional regulator